MSEALADYDSPTDPQPGAAEEERRRFSVSDDSGATWAMRKLAALRQRQAEINTIAEQEYLRIEAWRHQQTDNLTADINYFTGLLTEYARQEREVHGRKSITLPHGTIKSRSGSKRIEVTDEPAFLAWARQHAPTLIRVREEPDKAAIKASFPAAMLAEVDVLVDRDTGEVIPGVQLSRAETTYTVEVDG